MCIHAVCTVSETVEKSGKDHRISKELADGQN